MLNNIFLLLCVVLLFQEESKDTRSHAAGVDGREAPPTRGGERQMAGWHFFYCYSLDIAQGTTHASFDLTTIKIIVVNTLTFL